MDTALPWTAPEILALSDGAAARLFPGDEPARKALYRRLVRQWHPDRNRDPQAGAVFGRIHALYTRLGNGGVATREFTSSEGRCFRVQARRFEAFELGEVGLGQQNVFWHVKPEHLDLFDAPVTFRFANTAMEQEMRPYLPDVTQKLTGPSGGLLAVRRPDGFVRLRSLMDQTGPWAPRHVGWLLNSLHHVLCYLSYTGVVHHALTPEHIWVNPVKHRIAVLGGWFYALAAGAKPRAVPASAVDAWPTDYLDGGKADPRADADLVQALGRELLGDRSGMRLAGQPGLPDPLVQALRLPVGKTAVERYAAWKKALKASFGTPRFEPFAYSFDPHD